MSVVLVAAVHAEETSWPDDSPITAIRVQIEEEQPNGIDWESLALVLLRMKPGDRLTRQRLAVVEKDLSYFFDVKTTVTAGEGGVAALFHLRPLKRIKSIDIDGAYPLFEKDVLNTMTVATGDVFRPAQMADQEALVARRYQAEGYVDPRVRIDWHQDPADGHYRLVVDIRKGPYYVLEKIQLHGNHAIGDGDLLSRMSTWRKATFMLGGRRFQSQDLKSDIRKLIGYYREQGFAQAAITPHETFDPDRRRVQCRLVIEEGPRYVVAFQGNEFYSNFTLRRDLVLFKSGNAGNIGVRRSVQNIRRRYLKAGFAGVAVHRQETEQNVEGVPQMQITITIEEGPRHIVDSVTVQGNAHMATDAVLGQMLTRPPRGLSRGAYVADTLQEDLAAIDNLYYNEGFLSARSTSAVQVDPETARVRVTIRIDEGVQTRVAKVVIQGQTPVAVQTLVTELHLKPGDPYVPGRVQEDENRLAARISGLGYPHVKVQGTAVVSDDQTRADVVYAVESGPLVKVGEIFLLGSFRTRHRLMMRQLGFHTGDPFVLQKTLEAQRNLRNLNVFDSVQMRTVGLKELDPQVHLLVIALEKKPYYFETAGGYRSDKGIYGRVKVGDHNFLGLGKDVSLAVEGSQVGNRWEGSMADPRFLGTPIKAKASVYSERSEPFNQDIGTTTTGADVNFSYHWGRHFTNALAVTYERRQQYLRTADSIAADEDPEAYEPRTVTVVTPSIEYNSRDSFIQPRQGALAALAVDISKGLESSVDDFLKYRLDLRLYYPLHSRVVLAGRIWTGYIVSYNGDPPAKDQLLFLGGASTVRGFEENLLRYDEDGTAVGGQLAVAAGLETRIDIGRNFELVPFVDTGSVQDALVAVGTDDFRWSAGLGLEYITPIGPLGLYYGFKLDRRPGEGSGQVHIAVGYTF